jgi:hypothetical protein
MTDTPTTNATTDSPTTPTIEELRDIVAPSGWGDDLDYVFTDEDTPSVVTAFFPEGPENPDDVLHETVRVSTPRFRILDRGEGDLVPLEEWESYGGYVDYVGGYDTEGDAQRAIAKARHAAGCVVQSRYGFVLTDDERDNPRFVLEDAYIEPFPDWYDTLGLSIGWVSTSGWRGYIDFRAAGRWTALASGWVTGYPDEYTARKLDAATLHNGLHSGEFRPPVPIVWTFGVTSNVFSQTSDVFVPEGSEDIIAAWIGDLELGFDAEGFADAFS